MAESLRKTVEAVLFAAARRLSLEELARLCKSTEAEINAILLEWKQELESKDSPTMLVQDDDTWKLTVREKFISVVRKVVTQTEVSKSILETLAVVAYKAPVVQSKVIKVRTNKAYDHLSQLEKSGFITREKYGRSKMIKLTQKFFEYFDLDPNQLKGKFKNVDQIEKAIEVKEKEIEEIEDEQRKQTKENLKEADITVDDTALETYGVIEKTNLEPTGVELYNEKVGDLDVYETEGKEKPEKKVEENAEEKPVEEKEAQPEEKEKQPAKEETEAVEEKVEEKPVEEKEVEPEEKEEQPAKEETEAVEEKVEEKPEEKKPVEKPEETPSEEKKEPAEEKKEEKPAETPKEEPKSEEKPKEEPEKEEQPEEKEEAHKPITAKNVHAEAKEHASTLKPKEFKGKGLFPKGIPEEVEKKIEERIHKILTGDEEEKKEE